MVVFVEEKQRAASLEAILSKSFLLWRTDPTEEQLLSIVAVLSASL